MKILVIGGTGNIGLPLIQYLDQQVGCKLLLVPTTYIKTSNYWLRIRTSKFDVLIF